MDSTQFEVPAELPQARQHRFDRGLEWPLAGDDQIREAPARFHVFAMHGLDGLPLLTHDRSEAPGALPQIPFLASGKARGLVCLDKDRKIQTRTEFGLGEAQNPFDENNRPRIEAQPLDLQELAL